MSTKYLGEVSTPLLINQIKEKCALQYSTMPTASADYLGKIVQYIGADTDRYFQSGFYMCRHTGSNYEWVYWDAFRGKEIVAFDTLNIAKTKLATLSFPNENIVFVRDLSCYYTYTGRNSGDTEEGCIFVSDTHKLVPFAMNGYLPITWAGGRSGNLGHENSQLLVKAIKYTASMSLVNTIPNGTYYIDEEINITSGRLCLEGVTSLGNSSTGFAMGSCIAFVPEDNSKTLFTVSNSRSTSIKHVNFYCPYTTVSGSFVEVAETPHNYFTWTYEYTDVNCLNLVLSSLYIEDVSISGFSGYGVRLPKNCTVKDVRAAQCKYGFYECATDVLFHGCFARGCEYGFYWSNGTVLFMYDTWIDQCGYGVYSGNELSGEFIGGEIDHCLYAGFYAKNVGTGLKIISRFGRLGMYYLGTDMKAKAEAITTYSDADFDDMSKGVDIAIKNAASLDVDVSESPRYIADNQTGTNKLPTLLAFGNRWLSAIIKTVHDFGENTYHLVDTTHNDVTVVNVNTNSDVTALPTPTSYNVGKICTLTAPQTNYVEGGIYKCEAQGTNPETYAWRLINGNGITYTAGNGIKIEGDEISLDIPNFDESAIQILIRKGKNVLLSASSNKGNNIQGRYECMITDIFPSTDYKIYLKPDVSFSIRSWTDNVSGYTGSISTEGQWVDFSTNSSFVRDIDNPYHTLFNFSTSVSPVFENICAVKLEDWYEGMLPIDNSGYLYTLPYSLKQNEHIVEKLVNRDDAWYKDTICDNVITNSIKLDERSNSILTLASHIANNSSLGYTVSLIDSNGEILIENMNLAVSDMENLTISDYRFLHKGKEFQISAINESNYGLLDYDDTDYTNAIISPFVFFDAVNLGNNTIQLDIANTLFYKNHVARPSSDYQIVFDVADLISSMGLRLVFKFYTFNWDSDNTNNETLVVEKMFVDRYKNHKNVIGYSVANEPGNNHYTPTSTTEKARYLAFMKEIHKYIIDNTNQLMFYETDVEGFEHDGNNLVHETHFYSPMSFSHGNQALQQYPYDKFVCRGSNQVSGDTYGADEPSSYPTAIGLSGSSGTVGWTDICIGRIINDNQYQKEKLYRHGLRLRNTKGSEYLELKQTVFNYYNNDDVLVRSLVFDIAEDEDINGYKVIWQKSGTKTYPTPSDYLSIVQEDDEYILKCQLLGNDDAGILLQLQKETVASSGNEFIDSWLSAFNPNEAYVEVVSTVRIHSDETTYFNVDINATKNYWNYCIAGTPNYMSLILNARRNECIKYNEPLYIGEVGVRTNTYPSTSSRQQHPEQYEKGGTQWAKDFMKIAHEMKLSLAWFVHTGSVFGLYETKALRNMQGYYWGKPVYNAIKDANTNHIIYDEYKLETEIIPNGFNAPTTIAVYDALELKADKTEVSIQIDTLPTASEDYLGRTYLYMGTTNANYTHGGIYECQEVTPSTDPATYHWVLISTSEPTVITTAQIEAQLALFD